jgi:hypothetical protein
VDRGSGTLEAKGGRREKIQVQSRYQPDVDAHVRSCQTGPCFVCEIVAGNPKYRHHIVYE